VKTTLRFEGFFVLLLSIYLYHSSGFTWTLFIIFFLLPDLSFLGYLLNKKLGAVIYNLAHSLIGPCMLLGISIAKDDRMALQIGLIWLAHIGFDRALGYGLKYSEGFGYTHLGVIGKVKNEPVSR